MAPQRRGKLNLLKDFLREVLNGLKVTGFKEMGAPPDWDAPIQPDSGPELPLKRAACVLIVGADGTVLAVSRRDDPTMWGLPGGKTDPGETPEEAAGREVLEETGLVVHNLKHIFTREGDGDGYTTYTFTATATGDIGTDEEGLVRWVTIDVLCSPETSPFARYNQRLFGHLGMW